MNNADNPIKWFVMTHSEMKYLLDWLKTENARRLSDGHPAIEPFYPRDFLKAGSAVSEDFSCFVFLKTTKSDIEALQEHALFYTRARLRNYLDTDGKIATVPDRMMEGFLRACVENRGQYEITPPLTSIETTDKVRIKSGPFAGYQAVVTHVRLSRGSIHLDLALQLLNGVMNIRMNNVSKSQIEIIDRGIGDVIRTDFIEYTQNHLLTILEHRVKRLEDDTRNRQDADMLTRLYRYRFHEIRNEAARHHFLALMLICAHLCHYSDEEKSMRERALEALSAVNKKSESKAATDTRVYLWIALYISTRQPAYRNAAKEYVQEHQPKSAKLRRFVSLIRQGRKI